MSTSQHPPGFINRGFLSCLCHEMRNSLQLIEGFSDILLHEEDPLLPEQRSKVEVIARNSNYLLMLLRDLDDLARLGEGCLALRIQSVAAGALAQECVEAVQVMADRKGVAVTLGGDPATFPHVIADPNRLRQILLNLLINAVKYNTHDGMVHVGWEKPFPHRVRLKVSDNGCGIAREQWEEVFLPFARLGLERSGIPGSGLGLAIAKELAERMGGAIGFDSQEGVGSNFWIDLPTPLPDRSEHTTLDADGARSPFFFQKRTIMGSLVVPACG